MSIAVTRSYLLLGDDFSGAGWRRWPMRAIPRALDSFQPVLLLLPWLLVAATVSVLVIVIPSGHYGLLLAVAPFIAAATHGVHATALVGALTVALYGMLRFWAPSEDSEGVWWIKFGLITTSSAIALLTSQARQRARELSRTRDIALALQGDLLPAQSSGTSTVEVSQRYIAADTEAGVGGDWFDVIPLSGARVALVIGDVVGRGVHAAALMGRLRTAVHAFAELDVAPDELLAHMDGLAVRLNEDDETRDLAATCLYLVYDPVSRACTLASAGHPAPAFRRPDGTVSFPELPEHPPLGFGDIAFESITLPLDEGTIIALYTDGLLNLRRHGSKATFARLTAALAAEVRSLHCLCDRICSSVPADSDDDIAVLLARVTSLSSGGVATWQLSDDPRCVAQAREMASRQLDAWGFQEMAFVTELVVSELVTNALRHASAPITLRLIKDSALICEVSDGSHTAPHLRRARPLDEGGRGLRLVADFTERWGTRYTDSGKTIWSEQPLPTTRNDRDPTCDGPAQSSGNVRPRENSVHDVE
ncbi:SpoIIE family protein phosphatase [Streptomyces caeni]|uniref:SpoIIE family protein phosphatase n=1 Tax=Streptomyces caeni TaxID=2307231 RepID=A0ABW4IVJ3_9ACTN